jgi:predicted peroxiredoxin
MQETTDTTPTVPARAAGPARIAVVIYSNVTDEAQSRAYRALGFVAELLAHGDDVTLVFDGGGSATLAAVLETNHDLHAIWRKAAPALRGVCGYCARAYGVAEVLKEAGIPFLVDDRGHASLRALLAEGRQIVTF